MAKNREWKTFLALGIVFALNSPAGATGIINLTKGAVYNVQEFDRNGNGGDRHLPSAFWWGEETRKKADQNTSDSGSSADPASGVLKSVSSAHGVGSSSDFWVSMGTTLLTYRGTNNETAARARITVEGEYKGSLTVFGLAAAKVKIKATLSSDDESVNGEAMILDHMRIFVGLADYQSSFSTKIYEGEIKIGRGYFLDVELRTGAGSQQEPSLPIPGDGSGQAYFPEVKIKNVKVEILETTKTAPPCTYEVPSNVAFSHEAESEVIRVTYHPTVCASMNWTVANPNPWMTVRETARRESSGQFKLTVTPNPGGASRTATITVAGKPVTVTQAGSTGCEYRVTPERVIFDREPGSQTLAITLPAGCPGKGWGASSTDKWIKVQDFTGGPGGGTVKVTILENGDYRPRVGNVTVAGKRREITQYGKRPCSYLVVPAILYFSSEARSYVVSVKGKNNPGATVGPETCNPFYAFTPAMDASWITAIPSRSPGLQQTMNVMVTENPSPSARTGKIYFSATGQILEVKQLGAGVPFVPCDYQVPAVLNLDLHAHTETIQVSSVPSGCMGSDAWQGESNVSWIEIQSAARNTNPGTLTIQVPSHGAWYEKDKRGPGPSRQGRRHDTDPRTGSLSIAGQTVVVNQAGSNSPASTQTPAKDQPQTQPPSPPTPLPCTYQVQSDLDVGRTQQTKTISVIPTPQGCTEPGQWEAVSNVSWITVGKVDRASNPRTVAVTIRANTTAQERSGTLTIAGKTVTATQEGRNPAGSKPQGKPKPQ
jgi:hypothetical protein